MSHFTVLVVGDNPEVQLAPFQENNMGDCPEEYLEFDDCTQDVIEAWNNLSEEGHAKYKNKPIEYFAQEEFGYRRDKNGERFGYYENPNAKWDWYQIGGRWTGFFKLKPAVVFNPSTGIEIPVYSRPTAKVGQPGLMTKPCTDFSRADQAMKWDIDFEEMRNEAAREAEKTWDEVDALMGPRDKHHFKPWKVFRTKYYPESIDRARTEYHRQPAVINLHKNQKFSFFFDSEWLLLATREQYIARARARAISTFAVLMDGKWYQRGDMGWWGMVSNESYNWEEEFGKLLDSIPQTTLLTVCDCHI